MRQPPLPCPRALSLPLAPCSGALSPACPPARVSCPPICRRRPCLSRRRWHPCPSHVPARATYRAPCPSFRCPCPCLSSAPALPCCCLHWHPARAPAPSRRRERPGPSLVSIPLCCCRRLCPPLVPALLVRLPASLGRLPPLTQCPRGWHPVLPDRRPPPASTTRRCSCGSVMPIGVCLGVGGRTGRGLASGKAAWCGYGLRSGSGFGSPGPSPGKAVARSATLRVTITAHHLPLGGCAHCVWGLGCAIGCRRCGCGVRWHRVLGFGSGVASSVWGGGCSRALPPWGSPLARSRSDHPDPPPMGLTWLSLGTATSHDTYKGTERHQSIELRHGVIMVRRQSGTSLVSQPHSTTALLDCRGYWCIH